ncbi:MAG: ABC transporter substrate-binding protein [Solirubrobacteraceae bacterium]
MIRTALRVLAAALAAGAALSGCGSAAQRADNKIRGRTLTIWVSAPLFGRTAVSGEAVIRGAALALRSVGARIGRYRIVMLHLDDADPTTDRWDPGQTAGDARIATQEPSTIGYIGDFNSGASAVSIPLLNAYGIAQVSPSSTAVGLTSDAVGYNAGEPEKYYPTGARTFVRLPPSDLVQANVQISLQRQYGCSSTYVLDDADEVDGDDAADTFVGEAGLKGLDIVGQQSYYPTATNYLSLGQAVAQSGADCVLIAAITDANAAALVTQIAAAAPATMLFATNGLAESTFADSRTGGIPQGLDSRLLITAPAPDPAGRARALAGAFEREYERLYGPPEPTAIYGYEAMSLMLGAISRATDRGRRQAQRSRVVATLFDTRDRQSVLGDYSVQSDGNTTLDTYGVYRIVNGRLRLTRLMSG